MTMTSPRITPAPSPVRRWAALVLVCAAVAVGSPSPLAAQGTPPAEVDIETAPVDVDGETLFRIRGASSLPAAGRAAAIAGRIKAVARDPEVPASELRVTVADGFAWIMAGNRPIMAVTEADATLEQITRDELAQAHLARIRTAIEDYRQARHPATLQAAARDTAWAALAFVVAVSLVLLVNRWSHRLLGRLIEARVKDTDIPSLSLVRASRIESAIQQALRLLTAIVVLVVLFQFLSYSLGRFAETRPLARRLGGLVVTPLQTIAQGAIAQLPNLVFLAVLFVVFRVLLRVLRAVFDSLERNALRLPGFEPEWAGPTYKIVRMAVVAFGIVVAYPYMPGSQTEAFKGVSLFVGVLFSLGSSSAIANVIAGYMLIYRRAFRIGDRVRIGDVTGDVTDSKIQVTRLRSVKNEEVIIPNSLILAGQVVNYSALARSHGLILHTTVGIGYETPWRQVEAMLLLAASRTPRLLQSPAPFVLQLTLGDFAVTYELNVYTDAPERALETYSELHRHIQDVFNEYGVQIMTPNYVADTAVPKLVPPSQWHLAPAAPPGAAGVTPGAAMIAPRT